MRLNHGKLNGLTSTRDGRALHRIHVTSTPSRSADGYTSPPVTASPVPGEIVRLPASLDSRKIEHVLDECDKRSLSRR